MAITLRHDAAGIGGNPEGAGDPRRRFGQALVLQQQQIAQDNAQRAQDRMFELGRMRLANQFQFARDNEQEQRQRKMFDEQRRLQLEDRDAARKLQIEDRDALNQQRWIQQGTANIEARVGDVRGMLAQQKFTPEGQRLYSELTGALRAIEGQRDTVRPQDYNQLLNQWLDKVDRAGLDNFVAPPPTIGVEMEGRFKDLGNGFAAVLQPDGKMERWDIAGDKGAVDPLTQSPADYFSEKSNYDAAKKAAVESLQRKYEAENPNAESLPTFTGEQIQAEMLREFNERQGFLRGLAGNQGGNPAVPPVAGGAAPPVVPKPAAPPTAPPVQPQAKPPVIAAPPAKPPASDTVSQGANPAAPPVAPTPASPRLPNQPGALSQMDTQARQQLMAMPRRNRVEQLLPFHPDSKGRSLAQMLEDPVAKEEYQRAVELGLMEPGKYEEYALEILDEQLKSDLGIFTEIDAGAGLSSGDIKDAGVKDKVEALPKPKTREEALAVEGTYFVDPEGNMRVVPQYLR